MAHGPRDLRNESEKPADWDTSSNENFYEYYARESLNPEMVRHFATIRDAVLRVFESREGHSRFYDVADVGCGAGTQSILWAEAGHRVSAIDVNRPLVELGASRAADRGFQIDFRIGSASSLPWGDESMDVCLAAELIEHVPNWRHTVREFARVLRPGGVLFLATNNVIWPLQQEFNLPLYSWYPAPLKRHFEHRARTAQPSLANFATYPAVNWFTYYGLRRSLGQIGFDCLDRFELINVAEKTGVKKLIISMIRAIPPFRWLAVLCAPSLMLLGIKKPCGPRVD